MIKTFINVITFAYADNLQAKLTPFRYGYILATKMLFELQTLRKLGNFTNIRVNNKPHPHKEKE